MFLKIFTFAVFLQISSAKEAICEFDTLTFWGYTCGVINQTITDGKITFNIDKIDRAVNDVNCVEFSDSRIDFVPAEIFTTFPNADRLIFMRNGFKTWRKEYLQSASKLIAFVNADNQLETLDDDSFPYTPSLLVLTLYNNQLNEISGGAFRGLQKLSILQLSGNKLTSIDGNLFKDLESLQMLDLFSNDLSILPAGVFDNNKKLNTLRLDGNKFTVIAPTVFDINGNLRNLNVTENLILSIDAKTLPQKLEVIYVDHFTNVPNAPSSLKIIRL